MRMYYYDRAGNLVRTVPPAGVVTYTGTRSNGTTAHTLKTKYKYNSLKQLVEQFTPDGDTVKFWYDYKAQLRFSMNIKQKMAGVYSYTKYDNLGRITEVGESSKNFSTFTDSLNAPKFPTSATLNKQRTYTVYSTTASGITFRNNSPQRHLQNRVSYAYTDDNIYTYYSYDPHGNVEWLIQDIPNLGKNYVRYEYDLISNKVLAVHYNEGTIDEFHHRYTYDTDQRIQNAQTAWGQGKNNVVQQPQPSIMKKNSVGWDNDAKYKYHYHGPLKRSEIGEDKLQGLDYVYTINGWIKGINYPTLLKNDDPGQDSVTFGKDVFGMVLGYHGSDFNRSGSKYNPATSALVSSLPSPTGNPGAYLYNGNISNWTISLDSVDNTNYNKRKGFLYKYDQLNRIKTEDYYDWSYGGTGWSGVANSDYNNSYTFDGNGNILTLKRNAFGGTNTMDDQTYVYKSGYNRLTHIDDAIAAGNQTVDIDDQSANNYVYDSLGNLTKDVQEGIDNIEWTVYGKVKSVKKSNGDSLIFQYDASGNKIMKYLRKSGQNPYVTYYVRDAQGNIMSTYSRETSGSNYVYKQKELLLYGSEQLGILKPGTTLKTVPTSGASNCLSCGTCDYTIDITRSTGLFTRNLKKKEYELKDHLSNVRVTISDRKKVNGLTDSILSYSTYYAYGMKMPSTSAGTIKNYNQRTAEDNNTGYSFGYNGKEQDFSFHDDDGQMYDYGFRIYDPRMARFLSVDPLTRTYPELTPYQFASNTPIQAIDLDGLESVVVTGGARVMLVFVTVAVNVSLVVGPNGMSLYIAPEAGGGAGVSLSAGVSVGYYPNISNTEQFSGWGVNAGGSIMGNGGDISASIQQDETTGQPNDFKGGASAAVPKVGGGAGAELHVSFSYSFLVGTLTWEEIDRSIESFSKLAEEFGMSADEFTNLFNTAKTEYESFKKSTAPSTNTPTEKKGEKPVDEKKSSGGNNAPTAEKKDKKTDSKKSGTTYEFKPAPGKT